MQGVDIKGDLGEYFSDPNRKIPKAHLDSVCRIRQGEVTCRYVGLGYKGFVCMKKTKMKETLDQRANENLMVAKGDNCEGLGEIDNAKNQ